MPGRTSNGKEGLKAASDSYEDDWARESDGREEIGTFIATCTANTDATGWIGDTSALLGIKAPKTPPGQPSFRRTRLDDNESTLAIATINKRSHLHHKA